MKHVFFVTRHEIAKVIKQTIVKYPGPKYYEDVELLSYKIMSMIERERAASTREFARLMKKGFK